MTNALRARIDRGILTRLAGPGPEFVRGPATLVGGNIVMNLDGSQLFPPADAPDAWLKLINVRDGAGALRFVHEYGLLNYTPMPKHAGVVSEPLRKMLDAAETMRWIVHESQLICRAADGDGDALAQLRLEDQPKVERRHQPIQVPDSEFLMNRTERVAHLIAFDSPGELDSVVFWQGLQPGEWRFEIWPANMRTWCFLGLGMLLAREGRVGTCHQCGSVFKITDPRQEFCSKACGARARYLRLKERRQALAKHKRVTPPAGRRSRRTLDLP